MASAVNEFVNEVLAEFPSWESVQLTKKKSRMFKLQHREHSDHVVIAYHHGQRSSFVYRIGSHNFKEERWDQTFASFVAMFRATFTDAMERCDALHLLSNVLDAAMPEVPFDRKLVMGSAASSAMLLFSLPGVELSIRVNGSDLDVNRVDGPTTRRPVAMADPHMVENVRDRIRWFLGIHSGVIKSNLTKQIAGNRQAMASLAQIVAHKEQQLKWVRDNLSSGLDHSNYM